MSKTPTKNCPKKKAMKHRNTTSRAKKKMFKLCLQIQRKTKFQETKICLAVYTKKKPNQNLAVIFISYKYGLLRCFHK